jgi:hypothetical protein
MKLDPPVDLAHAVHTRPGVYALLLGSGISRAAGIPTSDEIMNELIRRQVSMTNVPMPADTDLFFVVTQDTRRAPEL